MASALQHATGSWRAGRALGWYWHRPWPTESERSFQVIDDREPEPTPTPIPDEPVDDEEVELEDEDEDEEDEEA